MKFNYSIQAIHHLNKVKHRNMSKHLISKTVRLAINEIVFNKQATFQVASSKLVSNFT